MARCLAENGREVHGIFWKRSANDRLIEPENWLGKRDFREVAAGYGKLSLVLRLPLLYVSLLKGVLKNKDIDAVYLTHLGLLPLAPLVRLLRPATTVFYDAPEYYTEDFLAYFPGSSEPLRWCLRFCEKLLLRFTHAVTTIDTRSSWLEKYYAESGVPVRVILNTPALADDPGENAVLTARQELGIGKRVAFVGSLKNEKGLTEILDIVPEVVERVPGTQFLFIGNLQQDEKLLRQVSKLSEDGHLLIKPFMPYQELLAYLKSASVGLAVLQKKRNTLAGSGNCRKIFTYMQAAIPVIVTKVGAVDYFVKSYEAGTSIEAGNRGETVNSICRYLEQEEVAEQHGSNGRKAFESRLNWESESFRFLEFVNQHWKAA